jgi:hypothetical protein
LTAEAIIAALQLPASARIDRRVPKTLLVEHGAPTPADKKRINECIEEVQWIATLKPTTIGVPAWRDEIREYSEIAVLSVTLRPDANSQRLESLIHRAVPYPVFLVVAESAGATVSLAQKRWSQNEAGVVVLDGDPLRAGMMATDADEVRSAFFDTLSLAYRARVDLFQLYQSWMDSLLALLAARMTGTFAIASAPARAAARAAALRECSRLESEIDRLRSAAAKERQIAKQVELTLELKRAEAAHLAARTEL